ncbi:C39 family peptidase [Caulobacter sp. 17J65-9]|uniref:C39 family peptidase n=1 Tax=Caulobacter sp. 17J65-9 TaxID=2709382 RepID=UPI0013CA5DFF|nr:C39 family peptidase [Caulobacter sp. 17J65-9]NEX95183.1 C39 family peptidase [Caulobacter sp. 17J65-9]
MIQSTRLLLMAGAALLAASAGPASAEVLLSGQAAGGSYAVKVVSYRDIPFRTVVRQQYDFSCGSAALATLLRYHYGMAVGETDTFKGMWDKGDQTKIQKVGFSLLDMKRYLESHGYRADGFRLPLSQLEQVEAPGIALIDLGSYRHFVVIKGVRGDKVLVGDPAHGLKTYSRADFEKMWNGVVFAIHSGAPAPGEFNRDAEWKPFARAPLSQRLADTDLEAMTRDLSPMYQITLIHDISTPVTP